MVSPPLGTWEIKNGSEEHKMWLLRCGEEASTYPEAGKREKKWLPVSEGLSLIDQMQEAGDKRSKPLREILLQAVEVWNNTS